MKDTLRRAARAAWRTHSHLMQNDPLYPVLVHALTELIIRQRVNLTRLAAAVATALMAYLRQPWDEPDDGYGSTY